MKRTGIWANDDFLKLWIGETISIFGSLIGRTSLIFAAVLVLDASALEVGLLAAADIVPGLAFGFLAGVWVDRLHRRPILIAADVGRAALLLTVPLAYAFDSLTMGQLYAVAAGTGALTIFVDVAYFAYVPSLLTGDQLLEGNSKVAASSSVAEIGAFSTAGLLVQALTAPIAVLVDAFSFLISSVFTFLIRKPEKPVERPKERASLRAEVSEGLRTIRNDSVLSVLGASEVTVSFSFSVYGAVYLLFVTKELGFEPGVLGFIFAVGGISSLVGSLFAGRSARGIGAGPTIALGRMALGAFMLLLPVAQDASIVAGAFLIGQQLGDGFWTAADVNDMTIRQAVTPERLLGRVNAALRQAVLAAMLAGSLAGGVIDELAGLRAALLVGCAGTILGGAIALLPAVRSTRSIPTGQSVPSAAPSDP
ncbi:MAG TPA: MFS transporter [Dehalococcoidia bacterium]